jgi:prepilin-type N-terminal cleavage/methylation domain-containing protein
MLFTRCSRFGRRHQRGFTLVEVLIATAMLGFSLVVMFGFHAQAVRSNRYARKITDCSFLAQERLELLLAHPWDDANPRSGTDLDDGWNTTSTASNDWLPLYHPNAGSAPTQVNAVGETLGAESAGMPAATYYVTWQVQDTSTNGDWVQIWVRCTWEEAAFGTWHGTTLSAYKFEDM